VGRLERERGRERQLGWFISVLCYVTGSGVSREGDL
jgi:hypothetical protein